MRFSVLCNRIFWDTVLHFDREGSIDLEPECPYESGTIERGLFELAWHDSLVAFIRDQQMNPIHYQRDCFYLCCRMMVLDEYRKVMRGALLSYFVDQYGSGEGGGELNTEGPVSVLERLSALTVQIHRVQEQLLDESAPAGARADLNEELNMLLLERRDVGEAFDRLLEDYKSGKKRIAVYGDLEISYKDSEVSFLSLMTNPNIESVIGD